jgi:hypothetical protein
MSGRRGDESVRGADAGTNARGRREFKRRQIAGGSRPVAERSGSG